jgi:SAM-dependent methyltransferase
VTCIEPDPPAAARLRQLGLNVVESLTDVPDESVDAILMVEVIEHLDDPMAVLAILRTKLRQDGRLFVTTPVGETRRGSTDTIAYDTAEHVHFFSERSLARALAESGFPRHRFLTVNAMYPPGVGLQERIKVSVKRVARPIWSRLFGYRHLVVKASPSSER